MGDKEEIRREKKSKNENNVEVKSNKEDNKKIKGSKNDGVGGKEEKKRKHNKSKEVDKKGCDGKEVQKEKKRKREKRDTLSLEQTLNDKEDKEMKKKKKRNKVENDKDERDVELEVNKKDKKRNKEKRDKSRDDDGRMTLSESNKEEHISSHKEKKKKKKKKGGDIEPLMMNNSNNEKEDGSVDVEGDTLGSVGKRKRSREKEQLPGKNINKGETKRKNNKTTGTAENMKTRKPSKRVKFSDNVEVFPAAAPDVTEVDKENKEKGLVRGKRFSREEDVMVKDAVFKFIEEHALGDDGIEMVLRCKNYPETKNCWVEISTSIPWRTRDSIYNRAHLLFERAEKRKWTPEELETIKTFHEKYGPDWRTLADELGKYRIHVKDTWRRICLPNGKKGHWSQDEYQQLFDLVNMDLRMKISEEKKSKHGMLRDNIAWEAISTNLSTRTSVGCCQKWYEQLESRLVREDKWASSDDIRLLDALLTNDFSSLEEVDWDSLLDHRPGDICRKRWCQMVNHLGEHKNKSFADQVEVLSKRYRVDVLEARAAYEERTPVD